jgi:hypothetical protein
MWLVATICVITLAFLYGRRLGRSFRNAPPSGYVAGDVMGFAQVSLPKGWHVVAHLKQGANLQVQNTIANRFMIAISECRGDFVSSLTRDLHSELTRSKLESNVRLVETRGPVYRSIDGYEAVQFEIDAIVKRTRIIYLHTTFAGARAFHQILCWSTRSAYDRAEFDRLIDGFRERPGPPPPAPLENPKDGLRAIGFREWGKPSSSIGA